MTAPDLRYKANSTIDLGNDQLIYVERYGVDDELSLVFVNNFYIVAPMWRTYLPKVLEKHSVVLYDLENQGGSAVAENPTVDHHVETLHQMLEYLEKRRVVLVGTSTSCLIAARYAMKHPQSVAGLLLIGPSMTPSAEPVRMATERALMASLRLGGTEALWDHLYSFVFTARTMIALGASGYLGLRTAFMALHRQDAMLANMQAAAKHRDDFAAVAGLRVPLQVVVGDKDTLWQEDQIAEASALLDGPDQSLRVLKGLGHLPYLEDADVFQSVLLDFMARLSHGRSDNRTSIAEESGGDIRDGDVNQSTLRCQESGRVSTENVSWVLRDVLEHDVPMNDLMTKSLADLGVESWAFTAFLARLEAVFSFRWDFDAPAEIFENTTSIAQHISALTVGAADTSEAR